MMNLIAMETTPSARTLIDQMASIQRSRRYRGAARGALNDSPRW